MHAGRSPGPSSLHHGVGRGLRLSGPYCRSLAGCKRWPYGCIGQCWKDRAEASRTISHTHSLCTHGSPSAVQRSTIHPETSSTSVRFPHEDSSTGRSAEEVQGCLKQGCLEQRRSEDQGSVPGLVTRPRAMWFRMGERIDAPMLPPPPLWHLFT